MFHMLVTCALLAAAGGVAVQLRWIIQKGERGGKLNKKYKLLGQRLSNSLQSCRELELHFILNCENDEEVIEQKMVLMGSRSYLKILTTILSL